LALTTPIHKGPVLHVLYNALLIGGLLFCYTALYGIGVASAPTLYNGLNFGGNVVPQVLQLRHLSDDIMNIDSVYINFTYLIFLGDAVCVLQYNR